MTGITARRSVPGAASAATAAAAGDDGVHLAADEIGRHCRQLRVAVLGPAVFSFDAVAVDEPGLKPRRNASPLFAWELWRGRTKPTNHGDRRLLCARRERPGRHRDAEERYEIATWLIAPRTRAGVITSL
jgi:hypothetical protein